MKFRSHQTSEKCHPKSNITSLKTLTFIKLRFQMQNMLPLASETTISHSIKHTVRISRHETAPDGACQKFDLICQVRNVSSCVIQ